jgi:hypothetical protein
VNTRVDITAQEQQWLFGWLQRAWKTAPSTSWQADFYGERIDLDDLRSHFMEDALRDSDVIWDAILQWSQTERWPRLKRPTAYFLRERLLSTQACVGMLEFPIGTRFKRSSLAESRATEILRSLLVDYWRESGAAEWTQAQLDERAEHDSWSRFNFPEDYDD